jgi:hypothetical protein
MEDQMWKYKGSAKENGKYEDDSVRQFMSRTGAAKCCIRVRRETSVTYIGNMWFSSANYLKIS